MLPSQVTDINGNLSIAALDAFGRVLYNRIWGAENGANVGFDPATPFTPPTTVEGTLALTPPLPVASSVVYVTDSWSGDKPMPVHIATVTADRYPNDSLQQILALVSFVDGLSRALQVSQRVDPGMAYQLTDTGDIAVDDAGNPIQVQTDTRYAISGRVEYDGKGSVIRSYQPFFLNDWQYINNQSVHDLIYSTEIYYDALSRVVRTVNAKGYETHGSFYPWFTVSEDENDT